MTSHRRHDDNFNYILAIGILLLLTLWMSSGCTHNCKPAPMYIPMEGCSSAGNQGPRTYDVPGSIMYNRRLYTLVDED